jgi:hypothetical protein
MRISSTCFRERSDNEWFFQTPEDSFLVKLSGLNKGIVFAIGILPPQYNPSSLFSFRAVRLWRMMLFGKLPGDMVIRRGNSTFFFPIVTSIVVSIVLTILINLFLWIFRR